MKVDVRCCCDPFKVLGTIEFAHEPPKEAEITFALRRKIPSCFELTNDEPTEHITLKYSQVWFRTGKTIRTVSGERDVYHYEWALQNKDHPMSKLKRVYGFVPEKHPYKKYRKFCRENRIKFFGRKVS